jgi:hypothetical protein
VDGWVDGWVDGVRPPAAACVATCLDDACPSMSPRVLSVITAMGRIAAWSCPAHVISSESRPRDRRQNPLGARGKAGERRRRGKPGGRPVGQVLRMLRPIQSSKTLPIRALQTCPDMQQPGRLPRRPFRWRSSLPCPKPPVIRDCRGDQISMRTQHDSANVRWLGKANRHV